MKFLGQVLVCLALAGASGAAAAAAPGTPALAPGDPAYLSFTELYRLTVSGGAAVEFNGWPESSAAAESASAGASARPVAATSAAPQPAPATYTISSSMSGASLPEPSSRWLLVLSAFALAAWVARRRLGYSL